MLANITNMPPALGVTQLQLFSTQAQLFVGNNPQSEKMESFENSDLKANLQVTLIMKKLLEGNACTALDLSSAPIPLRDYQSFIKQYKVSELTEMQNQLAEKIKSPALSQTQRQAELRCILALVYLQQDRTDKARAQLKQADKTPGFTLLHEFDNLYNKLKHPGSGSPTIKRLNRN